MKKRRFTVAAAVMIILSMCSFVAFVGADIAALSLSQIIKIISALAVFGFGFLGARFLGIAAANGIRAKKVMKHTLVVLFLLYIVMLIDFTLIDESFGRDISIIFLKSKAERLDYLRNSTNMIPFETVRLFIRGYADDNVSFLAFCENLLGNIGVFMPFALFLPMFFSKLSRFWQYICVVAVIVIAIEIMQLVFLTGACDIDDLILNVSGAALAFAAVKSKIIGNIISQMTFGVCKYEK